MVKVIGRNDPCPCGEPLKYKTCCEKTLNWNVFLKSGGDFRSKLSTRGRNIHFINSIFEILQTDNDTIDDMGSYKKAFNATAVRKIHESLMEYWPPTLDIAEVLGRQRKGITGLYIGDYNPKYLARSIVRHSIYSNKILISDPFVYPFSVNDQYNPILNPEEFRSQTLKNTNFWLSLVPWIKAGLVEIIRLPSDFDPKLQWDAAKSQDVKFAASIELQLASEETVKQLSDRHSNDMYKEQVLFSAPDSYLRKLYKDDFQAKGITEEQFMDYIKSEREQNPNVLDQFGNDLTSSQFHMSSTGANYPIALLTANLTGAYLFTDLKSKWREIEIDRRNLSVESAAWAPFAKAFDNTEFKFLNELKLEHALKLRKEGRLESFRTFLHNAWKNSIVFDPYDESNATTFAQELNAKLSEAEVEWKKIDKDLVKMIGTEAFAAALSAGPLIASGAAAYLAAAGVIAGTSNIIWSALQRTNFNDQFPAAFFMDIDK